MAFVTWLSSGDEPMLRKIFNALVLLPLAIVFVIFAVANRHMVKVSFDPFNGTDPALSLSMPLFAIILLAAIAGVAAGGSATWFRQRRWRRAARTHERDARAARSQLDERKAGRFASPMPSSNALLRPPG
jgi:uncharacterized integral membrane protein